MATTRTADYSKKLWVEHLSSHRRVLLRVLCFPYAGGSANIYRDWQKLFSPEIEVCLVHLPGHYPRIGEQAFTRLAPLVEAIAEHISGEVSDPFVLYGHSMGALISFELARELSRRHSCNPLHLFLSGRRAPQSADPEARTFQLPDAEFIAHLKDINGPLNEWIDNPETRDMFMPVLRADFELVQTYKYLPEQPLSCPFTVYGGLQDRHVSRESLRGWSDHTSVGCKVRMFNGDHFFIRDPGREFVSILRSDVLNALQRGACGTAVGP